MHTLLPSPPSLSRFAAVAAAVALVTGLYAPGLSAQDPPPPPPSSPGKDAALAANKSRPTRNGIKLYESHVRDDPEDVDARHALAIAYAELGKYDAARREIGIAINKDPEDNALLEAKGLIEEQAGKPEAALTIYDALIAKKPDSLTFKLNRARALSRLGRDKDAATLYQELTQKAVDDTPTALALASSFVALGRYDEAERVYERLLRREPENVVALVERARVLANQRRLTEALTVLAEAQVAAPKDGDVDYNRGVVLFRLKRYKTAEAAFAAAAQKDPRMVRAFNNRGVALSKQRKNEKALEAFDQAIAVDADFADAHFNRGLAAFQLSRFRQAEASFEKALKIDPDYADAKFYLGEIYYQLKEPEKALSIYKQALRMNPDDAGTHRRIGDMYLEKKNLDLAIGEYWAAVDADDRIQENIQQLMLVLSYRRAEGDLSRAIAAGEAGVKKDPYALGTRVLLAELYVRTGKPLTAFESLDKAVTLMPTNPRAHSALGMHHLDRGNGADAKRAFEKALSLDADEGDAMYGLARLALNRAGGAAEGEALLQKALAKDPGHVAARTLLGCEYQRAKKVKQALAELGRAVEDDPRYALAWYCRARAESQRTDKKAAAVIATVETYLNRAVALQDDLSEAHFDLATIYKKRGDKAAAAKEYKRVLELDPKNEKAALQYELLSGSP